MSVKFACDRCGKRFASVDEPRPGRVYRIRCRCGNVVVLRPATARAEDAAPAPSRGRPARGAKREGRHATVSRPRPPPLPAGGAGEPLAAPAAAPARAETPMEVLEPLGEPTPPQGVGSEREPTFEPIEAPAPAPSSPAGVDPTPTIEPLPAPPSPPGPRVDTTPTIEPIVAPAPPPMAIEPTPPSEATGESAPPILDDPFARAAAEEARADDGTPGPARAFALVARDAAGAEETPVELSKSESFAVRGLGLGGLFRDVAGGPGLAGSARRRWIVVATGLLAALAVAAALALR